MEQKDSAILTDLQVLVDSSTRGDPQSPLCWTSKSVRRVAEELSERGHAVSYQTVAALLDDLGYSLQANRKTKEGQDHADRDAQFEYISRQVRAFQEDGQPAIVQSTPRRRKRSGISRSGGGSGIARPAGRGGPCQGLSGQAAGEGHPEGVYDLSRNEGWVSVGVDHDTSEFAGVISVLVGRDGVAGLSGSPPALDHRRCRGKQRLSATAVESGVAGFGERPGPRISVCHFPPGTSKWNKIEHRMFCYITKNWRGKPFAREPSSST